MLRDPSRHSDDLSNNQTARDRQRERERQERAQMLPSDDKDISASSQDLFHAPVKVKPSIEDQTSIEVRKSLGSFERVKQYMLDNGGTLSRRLIGVDHLTTGSGSLVPATTGQATSIVGSSDSNRSTSIPPHNNTSSSSSSTFVRPAPTFPPLHRTTPTTSTISVPTTSTTSGTHHPYNNFRPINSNSISVQKVQLSQSQSHPSSSAPSLVNHSSQINNHPSSNSSISSFSGSSVSGSSALSAGPPLNLLSNSVKKPPSVNYTSNHPTFHLPNNISSSHLSSSISDSTGDPLLSSASIHIPKIVRNNNNNLPSHAFSSMTNRTIPTSNPNIQISNPKIAPISTNNSAFIPNSALHISATIDDLCNPLSLSGASIEKKFDVTSKKSGPLERTESQIDLDHMLREMMDVRPPLTGITGSALSPVKEIPITTPTLSPTKKVPQRRSSKGDEKPGVDVIEGLITMKNIPSPVSSKGMDSSSSSGGSSSSESDSDSDSSSHSPGSTSNLATLPLPNSTNSPSRCWGLQSFVEGLKNDSLNNSNTKGPSDLASISPKKDNHTKRDSEPLGESRLSSKTDSTPTTAPLQTMKLASTTSTLSSPSPEKALSKPTTPVKSTSSVTTRSSNNSNAEQNQNNSKAATVTKSPRKAAEVKKETQVVTKVSPPVPPPIVQKGISAVIMKAKGPALSSSENEDEEPVVVKEPVNKTKPAVKRPHSAGKPRRKSSTSSCDRLKHKSDDDSSPETKKKKPVQDKKKSEMIGSIFRFGNTKDKVDSPNGEVEKGGKGGSSSATSNSSAATSAKGKGKGGSKSKPVVAEPILLPPPPPPPPVSASSRVSVKDKSRKSSSASTVPPSKTNGEVESPSGSKAKGSKSTPSSSKKSSTSPPKPKSSSSKDPPKASTEKPKGSEKVRTKTPDKAKNSEKSKASEKSVTSDKSKSSEKVKSNSSKTKPSASTSSSSQSKSPKVKAKPTETAKSSSSSKASAPSKPDPLPPPPPPISGSGKSKGKKRDAAEALLDHTEPVKVSTKKSKPSSESSSRSSTSKPAPAAPVTAPPVTVTPVPTSKEEPAPPKVDTLLCKIPLKFLTKIPSKVPPKVEIELEKKPLSSPVHTNTEKVILAISDDQDWYLKEAKRLKHKADKEGNGLTAQTGTYLEAGLYFILTGITMERTVGLREAFTMYKDTLSLIRYIGSRYRNRDEDCVEAKLMVLSLRCQSMLSLRLYQLKHAETKEAAKYLTDYFSKTPAAEITGIHPPLANSPQLNTPSPHSPTPTLSPAGSLFPGHHPSPLQVGTIHTVTINRVVYSKMFKQCTHTANLMSAHELWDSAEQLIDKYQITDFFIPMNTLYGPLTLHSTLVDLVLYVKHGLKIMKDSAELT